MSVQVQSATKNGQGESLSVLNRQFISFSYGGKNIEDFDLLVVFSNDRLDKEIYAPFNDTTTEQAELDGQMFWRSNFKAGQLSFTLATDGMTTTQLEDFKEWFQPGKEKELILSEYHNRGILARVATAPYISLLPFEKVINVQIGTTSYPTKTSLYKGEIKLDFVMDDPYWYSLQNIIEGYSPEEIKIFYEDGIPHFESLKTECFLAGNNYVGYATVEKEDGTLAYDTQLSILKLENNKIDLLTANGSKYLYYCGTAPEKPILSFDITPQIIQEGDQKGKISLYKNGLEDYYYLKIGNSKLKFNLPSLYSDYNKALDILKKYKQGDSILAARKEIRDNIYNYYTRSFIINWIDNLRSNAEFCSPAGAVLKSFYNKFIKESQSEFSKTLSCIINCQNGTVTVSRTINEIEIIENAGNMIKSKYLTIETRKKPNASGLITPEACLLVETNTNLENLKIDYKYKYL